jgi:hypothetical protein
MPKVKTEPEATPRLGPISRPNASVPAPSGTTRTETLDQDYGEGKYSSDCENDDKGDIESDSDFDHNIDRDYDPDAKFDVYPS